MGKINKGFNECKREVFGRLNKFTSIEHIDKIQTILLPKIEWFSDKLDGYLADNNEVKEVVRKFDFAISLKCSKSEVQLWKEELQGRFIDKNLWTSFMDKFDKLETNFMIDSREMKKNFDDF